MVAADYVGGSMVVAGNGLNSSGTVRWSSTNSLFGRSSHVKLNLELFFINQILLVDFF